MSAHQRPRRHAVVPHDAVDGLAGSAHSSGQKEEPRTSRHAQAHEDIATYKDHPVREDNPGRPGAAAAADRRRFRPGLAVVVIAIFVAQPLLKARLGWVPHAAWSYLGLAGLFCLVYKLFTFPRWADEHRHVPRFLACFVAMLLELSVENCMVWLVSASDQRKYDPVPGLQDNVEIAAVALAGRSGLARWAVYGRWANILHFLMALLALAFSVIWDQVPYSGFGIMSRVVLTICCSRILRVACFMSTVLPSPRPGCYARRFPPVPPTLWGTVKAGYTTIRGFGGCNDLIFSGHGAFWVLVPLAHRTYYRHRASWLSTGVLWLALAHTSLHDVVDRQHYSVDMILAVIVTWAVWTWLGPVYPEARALPRRPPGAPSDKPSVFVLGLIAFALFAAAVIVVGGKA